MADQAASLWVTGAKLRAAIDQQSYTYEGLLQTTEAP